MVGLVHPGSARFRDFEPCPNPELNLWSSSAQPPNLGLNFGLVLKSSGSNFGSEPNCDIPTGIHSLATTHEQLIIGWTGDINSPTPGEHIPTDAISDSDRAALDEALQAYQPKESNPDDDKKTSYVPVWLDDNVAHGHFKVSVVLESILSYH